MRKLLFITALAIASTASAQRQQVRQFRLTAPIQVQAPYIIDSLNVKGEKYDVKSPLHQKINLSQVMSAPELTADSLVLQPSPTSAAIHLAAFDFKNDKRSKVKVSVEGVKDYTIYVDGDAQSADKPLWPSTHRVIVKALTTGEQADTMRVFVEGEATLLAAQADNKRSLTLMDLMTGRRCNGTRLSPDGKYMIYNTYETSRSGHTSHRTMLRDMATGREMPLQANYSWMPTSSLMYYTRHDVQGRTQLVTIDPVTMAENVLCEDFPEGYFRIAPTEDYAVFTRTDEGRAKDKDVYEIIEPEDRMNGFRSRGRIELFDLKTGVTRQLTYGHHSIGLSDISPDGRTLLLTSSSRCLTERPTTRMSLLRYNLDTNVMDTLVLEDGFMRDASFSPDGQQVLLTGVPEAFGSIGKNVREGQTPNMYDYQMYIMTLSDKSIRPMTKYFNPSVGTTVWSRLDNQIYMIAEDRDCHNVFRVNPVTGDIKQIELPEEYISTISLAKTAPVMSFYGQSLNNTTRLYTMSMKKNKQEITLLHDFSAPILADVQLGEDNRWNFVSSRGDTLTNTYVLPPSFDPEKKYPMVVYYYGGCSPTSRTFDTHYPAHLYAALGYVVLIVNPSGATGFGQEWAARHVNTAGQGVADDIIESAKTFCQLHPWVNDKKVGCIGASYGGFMTQYIQTQTDFFAAAISHAGISDHTSYWGEGYWGYSYSEVSMANSYPWSHRDLYVGQSPLYNADKIHTPLLFLHGTVDTNVPVGESIQMFTALKLLGRPTAFVAVEGQDHHILDFQKRQKWQATIFAWFARWLQDDPSWWTELYGDKETLE